MTRSRLRFAVVLSAMFLLTLPLAARWPSGWTPTETLLVSFGEMTVRERQASYRTQSPEVKSALWRLQVKSFTNEHPSLTQRQRKFLDRAEQILVPAAFLTGSEQFAKAQVLCAEASEVFERAELAELNLLGGPVRQRVALLNTRQSALALAPWVTVASAATQLDPCDCKTNTSCTLCQLVSICLPHEGFCEVQPSGCGCFWLQQCNGFCWTPGLRQ